MFKKAWESLAGLVGEIKNLNPQKAASSVVSSRIRRFMDTAVYDEIAKTEWFQSLMQKRNLTKHSLEWIVYAVLAGVDQIVDEKSNLRKIIKDTITDSGSEMAKRLWEKERTLKERLAYGTEIIDVTPQQKNFIIFLIEDVEDDELEPFLQWLVALSGRKKKFIKEELEKWPDSLRKKFLAHSDNVRGSLAEEFRKKGLGEKMSETTEPLKDQTRQWLTERLERKKRERRERDERRSKAHSG
jgi:hypothetical protein